MASIDDDVIEGARAMGAPPDVIEEMRRAAQPRQEDACEVWPENWDVFLLFAELGTQWRKLVGATRLIWQGLDYQSVEAAIRLKGIPPAEHPAVFADLQVMERAALEVLNEG